MKNSHDVNFEVIYPYQQDFSETIFISEN